MDLSEILSARLRESRIKKGLKQNELSGLTGLRPATISAYESTKKDSRATPSIESLVKISEVLGVSIDYLCGLSEQEGTRDIVQEYLEAIANTMEIFQYPGEESVVKVDESAHERVASIVFPADSFMDEFVSSWQNVWLLHDGKLMVSDTYDLVTKQIVTRYRPLVLIGYDRIKKRRTELESIRMEETSSTTQGPASEPESDQEE